MLNYIVRRVAYAVLILLGVNLLTFTLFFAVNSPDNIARLNIGAKRVSQDAIDKWKAERGYDKPLWFNARAEGRGKLTQTLFHDRSLRLFTLQFGASDSGRDIRHEIATRLPASLALAGPMLLLTVYAGIAFALLLVFFRASYLDFWGTVLCVLLMSISSLFYIIMAQWLFGKTQSLPTRFDPELGAVIPTRFDPEGPREWLVRVGPGSRSSSDGDRHERQQDRHAGAVAAVSGRHAGRAVRPGQRCGQPLRAHRAGGAALRLRASDARR
jgi:ABC-type dipeptide/oligopeptide/nickel transport system permease component